MNDRIKTMILDAIKEYRYSSVILFGSRARNEYTDDSDYDLLLIFDEELSIEEMRKIQREIRKKLAIQNIDADVLVRTKSLIDVYKTKKGNVIYNAMREGVIL